MSNRCGQVDVTKTLTTHLGRNHLNTAFFADDAAVLHALVLAAVALIILGRTKDLGTEQTITLRLEGTVVDGLRLLYLAVRNARESCPVRRLISEWLKNGVDLWVYQRKLK